MLRLRVQISPLAPIFKYKKGIDNMRDVIKRINEIAVDGNFCKSSSCKTPELHLEMKELFGTLAPCQLTQFIEHENEWVRLYANNRTALTDECPRNI